jgi:hypothetical protein
MDLQLTMHQDVMEVFPVEIAERRTDHVLLPMSKRAISPTSVSQHMSALLQRYKFQIPQRDDLICQLRLPVSSMI